MLLKNAVAITSCHSFRFRNSINFEIGCSTWVQDFQNKNGENNTFLWHLMMLVSTMAVSLFTEVLAIETHRGFMASCPQMTRTEVDPDTFHSIQLSCKRTQKENEHITMKFLKVLRTKKEIEHNDSWEQAHHFWKLTTLLWLIAQFNGWICSMKICRKGFWKEFHLSRKRLKMSRT